MTMITAGPGTSLAVTGTGLTSPITGIQSYSFSRSKELAEFTKGRARVSTRYSGKKTSELTVTLYDMAAYAAVEVGQKYTDVKLTVDACNDAGETPDGADFTITLSAAVVTEVGELTHDNENDTPATFTIKFTLDRPASATTDPTWSIAAVAGA